MNIFLGIYLVALLFLLSSFAYIIFRIVDRKLLLSNYAILYKIFEDCKATAYYVVFRRRILVQSSSGFRINKDETLKYQSEYIKLTLQMCGPKVVNDLLGIYGDLESLSISLSNDFIFRVEQDEEKVLSKVFEKPEV
jgi:hypothetical protein